MALDTYANLKTTAADWMDREDLAARIPDFVTLAHARLNLVLRTREMEQKTTLTPVSGVCTLPDDYLEFRTVYALIGNGLKLGLIAPDDAVSSYGWEGKTGGYPQHFTLIGNELQAYPNSDADVGLIYYKNIPALSDSNPANWLLAKDPRTYLFATLLQASAFMMGDDRLQVWSAGLEQALSELGVADARARWARSAARVSGPTP